MSETFAVKTETFEGPLDLLLSLIEKNELSVNDIALSKVADDYLSYVNTLEELAPSASAQFLVVASTLLLIKSLSLLPVLSLTDEEESDIKELEQRLQEYKRIKKLSHHIDEHYGKKAFFFGKNKIKHEVFFSPTDQITKENMQTLLLESLRALPVQKVAETTVKKVMSLEDMIERLKGRIQEALSMNFTEFTGVKKRENLSKEEKLHVIVGFLALLELVKQEVAQVTQDTTYQEISIAQPHNNES